MKTTFVALAFLFSGSTLFADTIRPKGDENLGSLLVTEPKWATPAEANIFPYSIVTAATGALSAGVPARLLHGYHGVQLKSDAFQTIDTATVTVTKKLTTELVLSGLVATFETGSRGTTATDIGPRARLSVTHNGTNLAFQNNAAWSGDNDRGIVVLPGLYKFSWGVSVLGLIEHEIRAGEVARVNLTPPEMRGTILVVPPATREFRSPMASGCYRDANLLTLTYGQPKVPVQETITVDHKKKMELRAFPTEGTFTYQAFINYLPETVKVESGKTTEVVLRRIDVDHVEVTNEKGQITFVPGTYVVDRKLANGQWISAAASSTTARGCGDRPLSSFPTQTGLDVPRGEYRVTVRYTTAEGAKTDVHLLDLR